MNTQAAIAAHVVGTICIIYGQIFGAPFGGSPLFFAYIVTTPIVIAIALLAKPCSKDVLSLFFPDKGVKDNASLDIETTNIKL
jgi:hypothetical protein